ncbi:MAG: hypothetical protein QOF69_77 [Solirubrobacteraceae bacterium]|nr:hypothetical protein [Solirubrobacteraceae bacterium]
MPGASRMTALRPSCGCGSRDVPATLSRWRRAVTPPEESWSWPPSWPGVSVPARARCWTASTSLSVSPSRLAGAARCRASASALRFSAARIEAVLPQRRAGLNHRTHRHYWVDRPELHLRPGWQPHHLRPRRHHQPPIRRRPSDRGPGSLRRPVLRPRNRSLDPARPDQPNH